MAAENYRAFFFYGLEKRWAYPAQLTQGDALWNQVDYNAVITLTEGN